MATYCLEPTDVPAAQIEPRRIGTKPPPPVSGPLSHRPAAAAPQSNHVPAPAAWGPAGGL